MGGGGVVSSTNKKQIHALTETERKGERERETVLIRNGHRSKGGEQKRSGKTKQNRTNLTKATTNADVKQHCPTKTNKSKNQWRSHAMVGVRHSGIPTCFSLTGS